MIVSHKHKFIFIRNRKVGSTSTELYLHNFCGPDDIMTPASMWARKGDVMRETAQNWQGRALPFRELLGSTSPMSAARVIRDTFARPKYYNHMRASSVRARISAKVWNSYYKFCFERNPWDKCVSYYYWLGRRDGLDDLNTFYQNHKSHGTVDQIFPTDWERYTHRNRIILDDVFDYSDLEGGTMKALAAIGIPQTELDAFPFPKEKSEVRKKEPARIEPKTDAIIRRVFRHEIETFSFCKEPKGVRIVDGLKAGSEA